jgi:hypothetical protein
MENIKWSIFLCKLTGIKSTKLLIIHTSCQTIITLQVVSIYLKQAERTIDIVCRSSEQQLQEGKVIRPTEALQSFMIFLD